MAKIVFLLDFEQGHVFPTFGLARSLEERGHRVTYVGIPDIEPYVDRFGMAFRPMLEEIYPLGEPARMRARSRGAASSRRGSVSSLEGWFRHLEPLIEGSAAEPILDLEPDLVLTSAFLPIETLALYYRYRLPMAIFTPNLRLPEMSPKNGALDTLVELGGEVMKLYELAIGRGYKIDRLEQIADPLNELPELLACPGELDLPGRDLGANVRFIEPSIRAASAKPDDFPWRDLPEGWKLVYVSLGSQTEVYHAVAKSLYQKLFDLIRASAGEPWHFVLSLGESFAPEMFGEVPANVTISSWVPQIEVLQKAALAITHGGLGTVKECIFHEVPMVVLPLDRDQPENAKRIEHHRLGVALDREKVTVAELKRAIGESIGSREAAESIRRMSAIFHEAEAARPGSRVVESLLVQHPVAVRIA